jgi:hypothetical protein
MSTLVLALYAEGRSDEAFLPIIIQRTAQHILDQRGRANTYALEPFVVNGAIARQCSSQDHRPRRQYRRFDIKTVYEPLARQISLEKLQRVPAYQQFVDDMTSTLVALQLVVS